MLAAQSIKTHNAPAPATATATAAVFFFFFSCTRAAMGTARYIVLPLS